MALAWSSLAAATADLHVVLDTDTAFLSASGSMPAYMRLMLSMSIVSDDTNCSVYSAIDAIILTGAMVNSDYVANGGDGYWMFAKARPVESKEPIDSEMVTDYIQRHSPLPRLQTGRLVILKKKK